MNNPTSNDSTPIRVLVVDEPGAERQELADLVASFGFEVSVVATTKDALDHLSRHPVNILVTDLLAPRINGWDLVERVKASHKNVRVVVMTSRISESAERILTDMKVGGYILKPFNPRLIRALLRTLSRDTSHSTFEIVMVDGDRDLLAQVAGWVEPLTYELTSYTSLAVAEAEIKSSPPGLIVVDRKVGPFDGLALCRDIRQTPWTDHIPILLTGQNLGRSDIARAATFKINGVLIKPYTKEGFIKQVERIKALSIKKP